MGSRVWRVTLHRAVEVAVPAPHLAWEGGAWGREGVRTLVVAKGVVAKRVRFAALPAVGSGAVWGVLVSEVATRVMERFRGWGLAVGISREVGSVGDR